LAHATSAIGWDWLWQYSVKSGRRWWQKVIDVPLDLLALLLEWSGEDSWVHRTIGKHLDKPPERIVPSGKEEESGNRHPRS
jgi:hypothetical protein